MVSFVVAYVLKFKLYYIIMKIGSNAETNDDYIAWYIGENSYDYNEKLREFGAVSKENLESLKIQIDDNGLYFLKKEDAKRAIEEYIEPQLVMMKLCGEVK